jgi:hypothetical protein
MKDTLGQVFRIISLGIPLLAVLDVLAGQDSEEFQVEGVMHITQPHSAFPATSRRVQVNHRGNQWAIREIMTTRVINPASFGDLPIPNVAVHLLSSDGTNIYYLASAMK